MHRGYVQKESTSTKKDTPLSFVRNRNTNKTNALTTKIYLWVDNRKNKLKQKQL